MKPTPDSPPPQSPKSKYLNPSTGLFALAGLILLGIIGRNWITTPSKTRITMTAPTPTPTPTPDPLRPRNILLLGYAGANHDGGGLTDTMIIGQVQPKNNAIKLISIPRDTWVTLDLNENKSLERKINASYAIGNDDKNYRNKKESYTGRHGGGNLSKDTIEVITGLPIDFYVAINFSGFKGIIDSLGGLTVYVPRTFDDYFYPIQGNEEEPCGKTDEEIEEITATLSGKLLDEQFPCRFEHIHFEKGTQTMDGETALKFVRSRKSETAGGDFDRSLRQQAVLTALKNKVLNIQSIPKILDIVKRLINNTQTDATIGELKLALDTYKTIADYELSTLNISTDNVLKESISNDSQYILIPRSENWSETKEFIKDFLNPPPTPTMSK